MWRWEAGAARGGAWVAVQEAGIAEGGGRVAMAALCCLLRCEVILVRRDCILKET